MKAVITLLVVALSTLVQCHEEAVSENIEARGKKKYYALLIHFFYVVATKLFILKIAYGIIFYVLLTKGWHFVLWFMQYLKKKDHVEYIDHDYHGFHGHHEHYEPYHGYGPSPYQGYGPYHDFDKKGYEIKDFTANKGVYDSDGSYSVQS